MTRRGADLLVAALQASGVTTIFSLSGNQIMPIYDACLGAGVRIIHVRHEAAAVFMADAWGQLTGTVGVALVTAAPGAANAVGPLFAARRSESPVLLLTGDSPLGQDGRGAFQELDQTAMTAPLTKRSVRATSAASIGRLTADMIRTALSGRPGPVHLALPFDVVEADAGDGAVEAATREPMPASEPDLDRIASALARAERPLVLLGPALAPTRTGALAGTLSDALAAPVFAMESPRGLNDPALGAIRTALGEADLVVSLGKPADFTVGFGAASSADWIVVDVDPAEHERARRNLGDRLRHAIHADPRDVAAVLRAPGADRAAWRIRAADLAAARQAPEPANGGIIPASVAAAVQRHVDAAAVPVLVCDGGEFGQWAQAGTHASRRLTNGPSGAIGGSLPYAIAAKAALPDATVVALMGDGTVGFHLAEFETAARENLPFVAVVGNDRRWNAEHIIQVRAYGADRLIGCTLSGARYDLAAQALGGHCEYVTRPEDLDGALERAFASGLPACVNVEIEGQPAPGAPH